MKIIECAEKEYRARPEINASRLALAFKSIRHFNDNIGPGVTDAMRVGTALHMAALEPGKFKSNYVVEPEEIEAPIRIKKGSKTIETDDWALQPLNKKIPKHRELIAKWRQDHASSFILTQNEMGNLTGMLESLTEEMARDTPGIGLSDIINKGSQFEVAAIGDYKGIPTKGRADIITTIGGKRIVVDLKKTVSAHPDDFNRKVFNLHYDLQAAFYKHLFKADEYYWVAVEEKPTSTGKHPIGIYDAIHYLDIGQKKMDHLFEKIKQGGNHWFTNGVEPLVPASWMAAMYGEQVI